MIGPTMTLDFKPRHPKVTGASNVLLAGWKQKDNTK